jgi:PAS domain S-box-containing protein
VGVLIDAFNTMLEQIQERDRALVAANEELEVRVEERTAKVSTANEQLKAEIGHRNRAEQTLRERTERIIRHQATLLKLGNLVDTDIDVLCQATVEELSRTLEVERVSIWYVDERHEQLLCQSLFTLGCGRHESGAQMRLADFPRFRQALEASRIVAVDDVLKDQRTSELARYAQPLGITAMMDVPIRLHGKLMGVVCHEHVGSVREWTLEEQDFAGSIADMIMLKMERLERQKAQVALRESERRYRTLLKNIPQRIYYKDLDSVYQLCNESYAEDLKLAQPDDIQGKTDFDLHPEALARQYVVDDQRIMTSGESEEIEESYRQGDRELTIQTLKSPVRDEDGEVIGIFGIFWDITARKEAKLALADLNQNLESTVQELRRSNRELQDFAYVTAHDLKAPLRAIGTLTDWIYSDYYEKLDAQGRDQMQLVKGRVSRMNELIDSILRYSEIGRGSRSLQKINLDTLVSEVIAMIDPPEGYEVRVEGTLPIVVCEKIRLIQVFQNLIGNAIKYMNRPDGRIRIGCVADGDFWRFSVADNGPGIHEKYFEKIFKMFQTLTPRDELESTGIGLAVVKKVVELYGGRVWVESILGEGSVFCFTLPKAAPTTASLQAVAAIAAS